MSDKMPMPNTFTFGAQPNGEFALVTVCNHNTTTSTLDESTGRALLLALSMWLESIEKGAVDEDAQA